MLGRPFKGHYDVGLNEEIQRLEAEICWADGQPPQTGGNYQAALRLNPFDFPQTSESFGISTIPVSIQDLYHFNTKTTAPTSHTNIYTLRLTFNNMTGKRLTHYEILSFLQGTLYPVTPIHTSDEYACFTELFVTGG